MVSKDILFSFLCVISFPVCARVYVQYKVVSSLFPFGFYSCRDFVSLTGEKKKNVIVFKIDE